MKPHHPLSVPFVSAAVLVSGAVTAAQDPWKFFQTNGQTNGFDLSSIAPMERSTPDPPLNRFRLSFRTMFNVNGGFTGPGSLTLNPIVRTTPDGSLYNYNDGYVLADVSGNAGGQTWDWGYDSASQVSGNTILMHRATALANDSTGGGQTDSEANPGFELAYDRELGSFRLFHYGLEAALNYANVSLRSSRQGSASVSQTTDAYAFTPGTAPPAAPYQGTFNGPGFLINSTPSASTAAIVPAIVNDSQRLEADVWGLRLGPYLDFPVAPRVQCSLSAGLAAALLDVSGSWSETAEIAGSGVASGSGSGSDASVEWGAYAGFNVSFRLSPRWDAAAGLQFQYLEPYRHALGGRMAELDLSQTAVLDVGVSCRF